MGKAKTKPRKIDPTNMDQVGPYFIWLLTNLIIIDTPRPTMNQLYMTAAYLAANYTMIELTRVIVLRMTFGVSCTICTATVTKRGTLDNAVMIGPDCNIEEGSPFHWDEQLSIADNLTNIRLDTTKGLVRLWR